MPINACRHSNDFRDCTLPSPALPERPSRVDGRFQLDRYQGCAGRRHLYVLVESIELFGKSRITLAVLLALTPLLTGSGLQRVIARPNVAVIYVGARDCPPCRLWSRDYLPRFAASDEFSRLTFREVLAPKLFTLMDDAYWPQDLRQFRERLDGRSAVPLWFVVVEDQVALTGAGLRQWEDRVVPKVNSLLR
jgi:hypothetical protein